MYGIHRFNTATNAFKALEGGYGESYDGFEEMYILTDYNFQRVVFERFCYLALAKKTNDVITNCTWRDVEETYKYAMPTEENGFAYNDYFTDFNYFLASNWNKEFYTCLMSFKDDGVTEFDEENWDIASTLIETHNLCFLWEQAKRIVENNDDIDCFDSLNNYLVDNELCSFQVSKYDDLSVQLTDILNNEINNAMQ
jgi:hypothetical protein